MPIAPLRDIHRNAHEIGHFPKPSFDPGRHCRTVFYCLVDPREIVEHEIERLGVVVFSDGSGDREGSSNT